MQAFVRRADLIAETATTRVPVVASYGNGMTIALDAHGPQCTLLFLQDDLNLVEDDEFRIMQRLVTAWRDMPKPVVNAEANRRIVLAFPDFKQRNYTARYQDNQTKYGTDPAQWPQEEKNFKVEYDRGWLYVHDVRAVANAMTALPADPTANEHWPPQITPIA